MEFGTPLNHSVQHFILATHKEKECILCLYHISVFLNVHSQMITASYNIQKFVLSLLPLLLPLCWLSPMFPSAIH